jgi:hypothetical protein
VVPDRAGADCRTFRVGWASRSANYLGALCIRGALSVSATPFRSLSGICPSVGDGSHACCFLVARYWKRYRESRRSFSVKPINIHGGVGDFGAADACWSPGVDDAPCVSTSVVSLNRWGNIARASARSHAKSNRSPPSPSRRLEIGDQRLAPPRGVQATDQNADHAAVGRYRCDVVLGVARLRTDQHATKCFRTDLKLAR